MQAIAITNNSHLAGLALAGLYVTARASDATATAPLHSPVAPSVPILTSIGRRYDCLLLAGLRYSLFSITHYALRITLLPNLRERERERAYTCNKQLEKVYLSGIGVGSESSLGLALGAGKEKLCTPVGLS
jgi:hypothetical protein